MLILEFYVETFGIDYVGGNLIPQMYFLRYMYVCMQFYLFAKYLMASVMFLPIIITSSSVKLGKIQFREISLLASKAKIKVYYKFFFTYVVAPRANVICSYYSESSKKLRSNSFFLLCTFCFHEPIEIPSIIHNLVFLYSVEKFKVNPLFSLISFLYKTIATSHKF